MPRVFLWLMLPVFLWGCATRGQARDRQPLQPNPPQPTIEPSPDSHRALLEGTLAEVPVPPPALRYPMRTQAQGVVMELVGFDVYTDAGQLYLVAQVCTRIPGLDWSVREARLITPQGEISMMGFSAVKFEKRQGGLWRCDRLLFPWPDPASLRVRVLALEVLRLEQDLPEVPDCERVNRQLQSQGIRVVPLQGPGLGGCQVVEKPPHMTQEEAYQKMLQALQPSLKGPWTFSLGAGVELP